MPKLLLQPAGGYEARVIELKPGVTRLGRGASNDISFPFPEISERHCEILVENDFVFVRDMDSSNGTLIDGEMIHESALYPGQTLQMGNVSMILDAPVARVALPEIPKPEPLTVPKPKLLEDGYPACLSHAARHAIWECPHCTRPYCDECIRKLRRVGGAYLKLCPYCSNPCKLSAWSEMMRKKRKGFFGTIVSKISSTIKGSTSILKRPPAPPTTPTS